MKTTRLNFRKFTSHDFDLYFQLVGDYKVMKMISGKATTVKLAKVKFKHILKINGKNPDLGYFLISDSQSNEFIGLGKIVMTAAEDAEIGYLVQPNFWGKGYGSEISTALVKQAKKTVSIKNLMAIIDPENVASKKILKKSEFILHSVCEFEGLPAEIYKLKL